MGHRDTFLTRHRSQLPNHSRPRGETGRAGLFTVVRFCLFRAVLGLQQNREGVESSRTPPAPHLTRTCTALPPPHPRSQPHPPGGSLPGVSLRGHVRHPELTAHRAHCRPRMLSAGSDTCVMTCVYHDSFTQPFRRPNPSVLSLLASPPPPPGTHCYFLVSTALPFPECHVVRSRPRTAGPFQIGFFGLYCSLQVPPSLLLSLIYFY